MNRRWTVRVLLVLLCLAIGVTLAAKNCPRCGASNVDNARFCKDCGYEFPRVRPQPTPVLPALRVSVEVAPGVVTISSTPEGAALQVEGNERGTTPARLTDLPPGRYRFELTRSGYRSYTGSFTVVRPQGSIRVKTDPAGALVLVDGRSVGAVPDTGLLLSGLDLGERSVVARLAGRQDQTRIVSLSDRQPAALVEIAFPVVDGFLSVESDPRGALLSINSERVGRTSYFGALKPADYRLELRQDGFRSWRDNVTIRLGDTTRVSAVLSQVRARRWGYLVAGLAGIAGGAAGTVLGQSAYDEYVVARPPDYNSDQVADLRTRTVMFDWLRNVAGGLGVLSLGAFFVF